MQQVAFSTVATTGIPSFRSCPLNVRKDETEIISFTLNVKSDVCFIFYIFSLSHKLHLLIKMQFANLGHQNYSNYFLLRVE